MRRVVKVLAVLCALVLLAGAAFAYNAARWLKGSDAPIHADAVVVLAGRYERAMYAADLYRDGYAPLVVLSEPAAEPGVDRLAALGIRLPTQMEIQRRVLAAKGVPAARIEVLPGASLSTVDEAGKVARQFGQAGRRVMVVTSPFHAMRARLVFERALEGTGAHLAVCTTPYEAFPDDWWRSQAAAREVVLEWAKIVFYLGGGRFRAS